MHTTTTKAISLILFLLLSNVIAKKSIENDNQESVDTSQRRGGRKKKKVDGRMYASYGLSMDKSSPNRVIDYSAAAVSVASSVAKKPAARAKAGRSTKAAASGRPSAPGTQAKVDLRPYMSAVEDQADSNSCAANAVAGAYEYLAVRAAMRDGESEVGDISRLFIYYVGRKRDQINWGENPQIRPKDEGMSLGGAIEAVQLKGAALQSSWPFNLTNINARPTEEAFDEAMQYKVGDAMNIPLDLNRMRQCLSDGYPIIFGLKLTKAFFSPPRDGFMPTPDPSDPSSAEHGLHAMLIVGYNDRQRIFIVRNSWGADWGVGGYIYLSYDYVVNESFNFLGMYAIQSLTDDDLTPDDDDGDDAEQHNLESQESIFEPNIDIEDHEDDEEEDEEDDFDADDMFDTNAEARRAFKAFAGEDLRMSKSELRNALLHMGVSMITDEEVEWAFRRYDDDYSGWISFEQFLNMHSLFDGSLLWRRKKFKKFKRGIDNWLKDVTGLLKNKKKGYNGNQQTRDEDIFDISCMFSTIDKAYLAFEKFSGEDLQLSKTELNSTLLHMGVSMVTDEEIEMAFRRYDYDQSEYIDFSEFLDMRSLLDGSFIEKQRTINRILLTINDLDWLQNSTSFLKKERANINDNQQESEEIYVDAQVDRTKFNDIFSTLDDAFEAFEGFAGTDLNLSKMELRDTLTNLGIPLITDEEIQMSFRRYDRDRSGYISFHEFLDMRSLLDGSLLQRRRKIKKLVLAVKGWLSSFLSIFYEFAQKEASLKTQRMLKSLMSVLEDWVRSGLLQKIGLRLSYIGDEQNSEVNIAAFFDTITEAHRSFGKFARENIGLSRDGLRDALLHMGAPRVTDKDIEDIFHSYNVDQSRLFSLDQFINVISSYDDWLLWRRRKANAVILFLKEAALKGAIQNAGIQLSYD